MAGKKSKGPGWHGEPMRHSLAGKGIKTTYKTKTGKKITLLLAGGEGFIEVGAYAEERTPRSMLKVLPELAEELVNKPGFKPGDVELHVSAKYQRPYISLQEKIDEENREQEKKAGALEWAINDWADEHGYDVEADELHGRYVWWIDN